MADIVYTAPELVKALVTRLGDLWHGFTGYAFAYPEPPSKRPPRRAPYFVVRAGGGRFGYANGETSVDISINLEVNYVDADGETCTDAVETLHNAIEALKQEVNKASHGFFCGAIPGAASWQLPESPARPVWEAQINITFTMPTNTHDNGEWLV